MSVYYNEIDPFAAQWLRELIKHKQIADGFVDERSIEDVRPEDLAGYTQCHFFAGIAAWSYALRQAGWPDDRPVWTGSCPCQPFSASGKKAGFTDERHLWPAFYHLISQCRPAAIFGEQVASKAAEPWIELVQADLEAVGYAFGCVAFPAASVGAPHIRDRTFWLGYTSGTRGTPGVSAPQRGHKRDARIVDDASCQLPNGGGRSEDRGVAAGGLADTDLHRRSKRGKAASPTRHRDTAGSASGNDRHESAGPLNGFWSDADWLFCRDGKWRPVEPGTFALADGAAQRVGRLRGYGNAIVAPQAQIFIETCLSI